MSAGSVDEVIALFERWGTDPYDEEVSQLDHALQTAALAVEAGTTEELVAAALLHDVGHLLDLASGGPAAGGGSDPAHEAIGARYLGGLFPSTVTAPVALHVRAKRYRCSVDPGYAASLSPGSIRSLERQGGPLAVADVAAFAAHPGAEAAVALRGWDDRGKLDGLSVAPLSDYRDLLERVARKGRGERCASP